MSSPLAHGLLGLSVARLGLPRLCPHRVAWYAFGAFSAIAADLDFLPGVLVGNINEFHHGASHSIGAALIYGAAAAVLLWPLWRRPWRLFLVGTAAYLTHIVLDLFCAIPGLIPTGMPLLWPLTGRHWRSTWQPFLGIHHGSPGDSLDTFWERLVCWHNVSAFGREIAAFVPLLLVVWLLTAHYHASSHRLAED